MERNDEWREDLEPRVAIAARTIPKLEEENARLREILSQMRVSTIFLCYHFSDSSGTRLNKRIVL